MWILCVKLILLTTGCENGKFGKNCSNQCSENCLHTCNSTDGHCDSGCAPGFVEEFCNKSKYVNKW